MFYVPKPSDEALPQDTSDGCIFSEDQAEERFDQSWPARLSVRVIAGRNLVSMDIGGKSDPYCIVTVGDEEEKTLVHYDTVNPTWNTKFTFSIYNGPHFRAGESDDSDDVETDHGIIHYVIVDVWDKDTLNRDDFMGRVMVPVSFLSQHALSGWFSLGRINVRDTLFTGEIYLELRIESRLPITRWSADDKLQKCCEEIKGFELAVRCLDSVVQYPGESERVEMVLENVVIEVSKHRDVGTVYLTDYRLVVICKPNERNSEDHSMWIAFKNIKSVEKAEGEKAVRRSLSGNRRISEVKCLTVHCCDFKTIRLTFVDFSKSSGNQPQLLSNFVGSFAQNFLIPEFNPKNGELPFEKKTDGPRIEVLQCDDNENENSDSWSLCEDDDIEEGEELTAEKMRRCRDSSSNVLKPSVSASSLLEDLGRMWSCVQGVFSSSTPPNELSSSQDLASKNDVNTPTQTQGQRQSYVPEYVNLFYQRLTYFILNITGSPLSKEFVQAFPETSCYGWDVYNVEKEFQRQEVNHNWRLCEINIAYETCPSYPRFLYVPAAVEDGILRKCAGFRSKGRLPVLCWFNKTKGNFIMRCAQPRTGARKKFSVDDEYVIQTAMVSNSASQRLVIFDARSAIAASGNQLKGKGTEDIDRYPGCKLMFLNIPNIHAVRDSLEKLQIACETSPRKWFSLLEASQWLAYISLILKGALTIARHVNEKDVAALIHCSDGWDRTSQLSALAQILLDPFYRTIKGFQVLIEKEWVSFGHRFRDRNGHPLSNSNQRSPIFQQFLDCVWQILIQFPKSFEFTSEYLLRIVDHVNSGWFGTFLCNNEKEREEEAKSIRTISLWAHLDNMLEFFVNENYVPNNEVLQPTSSLRRLRLWSHYYLRYDETFWAEKYFFFEFRQQNEEDEADIGQKSPETVVWVANERVKECHDCRVKFTHFNRRWFNYPHRKTTRLRDQKSHPRSQSQEESLRKRACGQIFCNECSSHRVHLFKLGYRKQERVCDRCYIKHKDGSDRWQNDKLPNFDSFEVL